MEGTNGRLLVGAGIALLLASGPEASPAQAPAENQAGSQNQPRIQSGLSAQEWRADLGQMVEAIETHHFRPFHRIAEDEFRAAVDELHAEIPSLGDPEILLSMVEIVALLGDGHTRLAIPRTDPGLAIPLHGGHGGTPPTGVEGLRLPNLPVQFALFDDGLFVTRAVTGLERLVGAKVDSIGAAAAAEAVERSRRLAYADNEQTARWYAPDRLFLPDVLAHLGLVTDPRRVSVTVTRTDGGREKIELTPADSGASWVEPGVPREGVLYRSRPSEKRWVEVLPDDGALYVQMDELEARPAPLPTDWLQRAVARGEREGAGRLILDLRANFGGSGSWNEGITKVLAASPFNEYGRLYVLIGRRTFSAAQQLVQELEVMTQAIFVGEPTGSRPGHFGDPEKIQLTHSGLTLRVSTLYWSSTFAGDFREAVEPHLPVPVTGTEYFEGSDPVLEAALGYDAPEGIARQVADLLLRGRTQPAVIHFHRFMMDPREDHDVQLDMTKAGHRLLDDGHVREGYFVFVLTSDFFPGSGRAQAGLGRALELRGDEEGARERYERALELDPDNRRAREALEGGCCSPAEGGPHR